jgi:uncharacterized protein YndB with AHSA1/START domain
MASFTIQKVVQAPIDVVFDVLTDHRAYAEFSPLRKVELVQTGLPAPNGVGAIRALHTIGPPIKEQVTEYERPTRFVYKLVAGAPVRDHVGTVELSAEGTSTRMVYRVETFPKLPGPLGAGLVAFLKVTIGQLVKGIAKRAEQHARTNRA